MKELAQCGSRSLLRWLCALQRRNQRLGLCLLLHPAQPPASLQLLVAIIQCSGAVVVLLFPRR
jgi:hypothetical protein